MPRPVKCRKVCHLPQSPEFLPAVGRSAQPVVLTVDEYEAIRLIDKEGLSQAQCGRFMQVARTSVQRIYESARKKLADSIVDGRPLRIEGGDYRLCDGNSASCGHRGCLKQLCRKYKKSKGDHTMRVAVTYEAGQVFQHFGHTQAFKLYDIAEGMVIATTLVDTNGSGHGALAGVLCSYGVDVLICGGIGGGAQAALAQAGIRLYGGVTGLADEAVAALLAGQLDYDPNVQCSHHDGEHGQGHTCGSHGCGSHHCGGHQ